MKKLDEHAIIKIFQKKINSKKFVSEDVEIFELGKNKIVAKTDTMVESTDIPPGMKLGQAARKSVVACVSDFAAKGVRPKYGMISVNIPKTATRSKINEIASGFKKAFNEFDITLLGGDTNEGKEMVFNVCLFGVAKNIVARKNARRGDLLYVTGPFGYTAIGLDILLNKKKIKSATASKAVRTVIKPKPRLDFGIKNRGYFTSSMDSSDGLSTTLNEMSKQSKKKFIIDKIPAPKDLEVFAKSHKIDLSNAVFNGGEEYEFVFTASPKHKKMIEKNAALSKIPIIQIGYVAKAGNIGVYVENKNKTVRLEDLGWRHLRDYSP